MKIWFLIYLTLDAMCTMKYTCGLVKLLFLISVFLYSQIMGYILLTQTYQKNDSLTRAWEKKKKGRGREAPWSSDISFPVIINKLSRGKETNFLKLVWTNSKFGFLRIMVMIIIIIKKKKKKIFHWCSSVGVFFFLYIYI